MTTIEKGIVAVIVAMLVIIALSTCAVIRAAREFEGCTPSVVTETRDGKEVTSVECKP